MIKWKIKLGKISTYNESDYKKPKKMCKRMAEKSNTSKISVLPT